MTIDIQATIRATIQSAVAQHQRGNLPEAQRDYERVLTLQPDNVDALHLLGVVAAQQGRGAEAVDYINRAIALSPSEASFYSSLGNALRLEGDTEAALAAYRQALALRPNDLDALNNLATLLRETRQTAAALDYYQQAVALAPQDVTLQLNLGLALRDVGETAAAKDAFQRAREIAPQQPEGYAELGLLLTQEDDALALVHLQSAIDRGLSSGKVYSALAMLHWQQARSDLAVELMQKAVELDPSTAVYWNNLACFYKDKGQLDKALHGFQRALELDPDYTDAHSNLAGLLMDSGYLSEAISHSQEAVRLQPTHSETYHNLGRALLMAGKVPEALHYTQQGFLLKLDVDPAETNPQNLDSFLTNAYSNYLLMLHYADQQTPADIFAEHQAWGAMFQSATPEGHANLPYPHRRLRVGYVSGDFYSHVVCKFFLTLLRHHDPAQVEVFCYANSTKTDAVTQALQASSHHWRSIWQQPDAAIAEQIRQDGIDLLVDLSGHTAYNRLPMFAYHPAPVQLTYLGYPDTTGMSQIQYRITDGWADPVGLTETLHSETLLRLDRCFLAYTFPLDAPAVSPLPALSHPGLTFGSFNNLAKVTPTVVERWAAILQAVPDSRLVLKYGALRDPWVQDNYRELFAQHGIDASRLELLGRIPDYQEHLSLYHRIDIALDPFPYNGTTTTCEALWMGVPVLTLAGSAHAGRVGVSLLTAVGLSDWVAVSPEDYVEKAAAFAADLPALAAIRASLRERVQASPLCDGDSLALSIEAAYRSVWQTWCAGAEATGCLSSPASDRPAPPPVSISDHPIPAPEEIKQTYLQHWQQHALPLEQVIVDCYFDRLNTLASDPNQTALNRNNIAVLALIAAEQSTDPTQRATYLQKAIDILKPLSTAHPLCAAHLAVIYSRLGDRQEAMQLALAALVSTIHLAYHSPEPFSLGLVYLPAIQPNTMQSRLLTELWQAPNSFWQAVILLAYTLSHAQLVFYSPMGQRFLQIVSQVCPEIAYPLLQLGVTGLMNQQWESLVYLHRARQLMPNHAPTIQALYLAYYQCQQADIAESWRQAALTRGQQSPEFLDWQWAELTAQRSFTYVPFNGLLLAVEPSFQSIVTSVLLAQGDWFEAEIEFWRTQLQPGMTVIDVGANVGVYTFSAAKAVGPSGQVIAIEPFSYCVRCLNETRYRNQLDWVKIYGAAASNQSGQAILSLHPSNELNELVVASSPQRQKSTNPYETVDCLTLDSLITHENLQRVDWLKIDAEGHELQVLNGSSQLLQKFKPGILYENIAGSKGSNIPVAEWLLSHGYHLFQYRPFLQELRPIPGLANLGHSLNIIALPVGHSFIS